VSDSVVRQAFTELAPHYEETVDREVRLFCGLGYRELISLLAHSIPRVEGQLILDIASGTAVSSIEIARRLGAACRVVGLDITPAMMACGTTNIAAADLRGRIRQVCGSGMQMPMAAGTFDVAMCGLGTHHMDVGALLSEIGRVLKQGGHLVMADVGAPPHWRSAWGRVLVGTLALLARTFWRSARVQAEAEAVYGLRTAAEWRQLLDACGFGAVEIVEWPPRRFYFPGALVIRARIGEVASLNF
jgi:ubiquinone/menaquinone biosynthesis C-methylase UbiE